MTTSDRRKHERIKVRFPCELAFGSERVSGMVCDLSPGGLSVEADRTAEQGDSVFVRLHPKGRPTIDIETLVWNICTLRRRSTQATWTRLGLVLSEAPDEFLELLKAKTRTPVAQPRSPQQEATHETEVRPEAQRFSVRVKQSATSRTRAILVFAESPADAEAKALAEAGTGWSFLEATSR
jgi:hypothetical protein